MNSPGSEYSRKSPLHMDDDRGLDLLHGLLSREEATDLLEHLAGCPACESRFQEMAGARERLRATRPAPLGAAKARPARAGVRAASRRAGWLESIRGPRLQLAWIPAAALAIVLLSVFWPGNGNDSLQLLPTSFEGTQFRASAVAASEDLEAGLDAYANRDFKKAVRLLEKADTSGSLEAVRKVYLGSALAWSGKHRRAVEILEDVAGPALPDPWGAEARWTLYTSLKESGRKARADSLLTVLAKEPGPVGDRARASLAGDGAR